jgi:hypothetical protein
MTTSTVFIVEKRAIQDMRTKASLPREPATISASGTLCPKLEIQDNRNSLKNETLGRLERLSPGKPRIKFLLPCPQNYPFIKCSNPNKTLSFLNYV